VKKKVDPKKPEPDPVIATNHEARRDYFILEAYEAGIVLVGCEVKSLRDGKASLAGAFARPDAGDIWLYNLYIPPYEMGNRENPDPKRPRKLLLHKGQIEKLIARVQEKGLAIVPLKMYFKHGLAKVEIAVGKGKKLYDKRADIKKRAEERDIDRAVKSKNRR
jgi:SsrA-binding protein